MKKIIFFALMAFVSFTCSISAFEYQSYKKGQELNYNGIDFYVLEDSDSLDDSVTLLKKTPLTVAEVNKYGSNFINRYDDEYSFTAKPVGEYGAIAFKTFAYNNSNTKYCYKNRKTVDSEVKVTIDCQYNYRNSDVKTLLNLWATDNFDMRELVGDKYRLLSTEDLVSNYSYVKDEEQKIIKPSSIPNFLYAESYSYWIINNLLEYYDSDTSNDRAVMNNDGSVEKYEDSNVSNPDTYEKNYDMFTIRPVIIIGKKAIVTNRDAKVKPLTATSFKVGDLVEYNGVRYYVINKAGKKDPVLKLLKETPLTVAEVNKYGKNINLYTNDSKGTAKDINGYGGIAYYSRTKCNSRINTACSSNFSSSDIYPLISNWASAVTNDEDLYEDDDGYTARILNGKDILKNLGYGNNGSIGSKATMATPDFLLHLVNCWTMLNNGDGNQVLVLSRSGNLVPSNVYENDKVVCPVINYVRPGYEVVPTTNTGMSKPIVYAIIGFVITMLACGIYVTEKIIVKRRMKQSH